MLLKRVLLSVLKSLLPVTVPTGIDGPLAWLNANAISNVVLCSIPGRRVSLDLPSCEACVLSLSYGLFPVEILVLISLLASHEVSQMCCPSQDTSQASQRCLKWTLPVVRSLNARWIQMLKVLCNLHSCLLPFILMADIANQGQDVCEFGIKLCFMC